MSRYVIARIVALPGQAPRLEALIAALAKDVRAEPGCLRFEVYSETDAPGRLTILEEYRDQAAFEAHLAMPHGRRFNETLKDIAEGGASEVIHVSRIAG